MTVTIKDIAKRIGKSIATVSRALNDHDDIGAETKALVRQTAKEMGYIPNVAASQLQKRRTDTIGLILPSSELRFSDPFFGELLTGITEETNQHGYSLLVSTVTAEENEVDKYLRYMRSRRVAGFIIIRTQREDERINALLEHDFPFVAFGRVDGENNFPYVDDDGELGIRQAVGHLVALGHTRLACITEPKHLTRSNCRQKGFWQGLQEHGLPIDESLILEGGFRRRSGRNLTHQLLDMENPPTAIVAVNDLLALGAMQATQERGLVVGEDISITGFDDILLAEYVHPLLTTVHIPAYEMGVTLFQLLMKRVKGKLSDNMQVVIQPELVVRQSTGSVKA